MRVCTARPPHAARPKSTTASHKWPGSQHASRKQRRRGPERAARRTPKHRGPPLSLHAMMALDLARHRQALLPPHAHYTLYPNQLTAAVGAR